MHRECSDRDEPSGHAVIEYVRVAFLVGRTAAMDALTLVWKRSLADHQDVRHDAPRTPTGSPAAPTIEAR